jgi:putative Mg2+ transporter-C (MgtC) family protein
MILDPVPQLTAAEALIRLSLAFGAGFIIGFERETHGRPAGFRTTILTCVAAALAMVLSEFLFSHAIDENVTWLQAF